MLMVALHVRNNKYLYAAILIYVAVFGLFVSLRHYHFLSQSWDLGIFVQSFHQTIHGEVMVNSLEEISHHFGIHWSPWLLVLVPGYWLFQSPYYLLIVQTLFLALGAVPLYFLAFHKLDSKKLATLVSVLYLAYPTMHWVASYDFHAISFFIPFYMASFYFIETERWTWAAVFLALAASTKENAIIAVVFIGLYYLFDKSKDITHVESSQSISRKHTAGLVIVAIGVIYFAIVVLVIMPRFGGGLVRLDNYYYLGTGPSAILQTFVLHPLLVLKTMFTIKKVIYLFWLFIPTLFFMFWHPRSLILIVPGLFQNLLALRDVFSSGFYHYDSILIPGIIVGTVFGLQAYIRAKERSIRQLSMVFVVVIVVVGLLRSPLSPLYGSAAIFTKLNDHEVILNNYVSTIPQDVSVAADTFIVPHVAQRAQVFILGTEPFGVDLVINDQSRGRDSFESLDAKNDYLEMYAESNEYQTEYISEDLVVYKKYN